MINSYLLLFYLFIFTGISQTVFSYAGEVEIHKLQIQFPKNEAEIDEIFELTVSAEGEAIKKTGHELSLIYTSVLSIKEIDLINVKQQNHINFTNQSKIDFSFTLVFQFKANKAGKFIIPNLAIAFPLSDPFITTPQQEITVKRDFLTAFKPYLIVGGVFLLVLYLVLYIKLTPQTSAHLLEKKIYKKFIKIKKDKQEELHKLILNYLNRKFKKDSLKFNSIHDIKQLNLSEEQQVKILRVWNFPYPQTSQEKEEELEEYFKTFLYIFQDMEPKPIKYNLEEVKS